MKPPSHPKCVLCPLHFVAVTYKHPSLPKRPWKAGPSMQTSLILLSSFIISTGLISFF